MLIFFNCVVYKILSDIVCSASSWDYGADAFTQLLPAFESCFKIDGATLQQHDSYIVTDI